MTAFRFHALAPVAACVVALWPAQAHASGVLLRLNADRALEGPVTVTVTPAEGTAETVSLADDGAQPDVTADDGNWAGALFLPHAEVDVLLTIGDKEYDGGSVSWSSADVPRDLDFSLRSDQLTVTPREANPHGEGTTPGPPTTDGGASSNDSVSAVSDMDTGYFMIAGGFVALIALGLALVQIRQRMPARRSQTPRVELQPAGGFAGPNSPTLIDGLTYWTLPDEDAVSALLALVADLSEHHSVLVVGDDLPPALGAASRSVYTCVPDKPRRIGDHMEALHKDLRQRTVVVFWGQQYDEDSWADQDDELPVGCGGVALLATDAPNATHRIQQQETQSWWVEDLRTGTRFSLGWPG